MCTGRGMGVYPLWTEGFSTKLRKCQRKVVHKGNYLKIGGFLGGDPEKVQTYQQLSTSYSQVVDNFM